MKHKGNFKQCFNVFLVISEALQGQCFNVLLVISEALQGFKTTI